MKNAFITVVLALALASFFSFTNSKPVSLQDEYYPGNPITFDTVPKKKNSMRKDSMRKDSKTTPYDSFGKPKKMDTTHLK